MFDYTTPASAMRLICIDRIQGITAENSYIGTMPSSSDAVVFIDRGGPPQNDKIALDEFRVQVMSKGNYSTAYNHLRTIKEQLQSIPRLQFNDGSVLVGVWFTSNIAVMDRNEQKHTLCTLNMRLTITPATAFNRGAGVGQGAPATLPPNPLTGSTLFEDLPPLP